MKKLASMLVFALVCVFAQTSEQQAQPPAASKEDVQKLEYEIQRLADEGRKAREAAITAERLTTQERKKVAEAITANAKAQEEARGELKKLQDSIVRQERNAREDRLRYERNRRYFMWSIAGLLLAGAGFLVYFSVRKKVTKESQPEISADTIQPSSTSEPVAEVQRADNGSEWIIYPNPNQTTLKEMMVRLGVSEGSFNLSLCPGCMVTVTAVLVPEKKNLRVRFPGEVELVDWKDRRDNRFARRLMKQAS